MMASAFAAALVNAGIRAQDAGILETEFGNEGDFSDGLEQVAALIALQQPPGTAPPSGEPWRSIYAEMAQALLAGQDHDAAWQASITRYAVGTQFALTNAVKVAGKAVADQEALKKKKGVVKTTQYLKELKHLGYRFWLNTTDDIVEVENGSGTRERMSDPVLSVLHRRMADAGLTSLEETVHCINVAAYHNRYHPVREYLMRLQWDGQGHIAQFCAHVQDDRNLFYLFQRKWMIGAVAKAFTGAQNPVLVLDGKQNIGKSSLVRWLCSGLPTYYTEAPIIPDSKDDQIKLINKWIWEVKELGSTIRKADIESLKGFLTTEVVTVRRPYAHFDITKPALASFIGTVNNVSGVLNDASGSRRFHIVKLTRIDWGYAASSPDPLWAEATAAYLANEPWGLTPDEQKLRDEINEEYQVENPLEGVLLKYFVVDPTQTGWWLPSSDIIQVLEDPYRGGMRGATRGTAMQLAETMMKLGCARVKRRNALGQVVNGYVGIRNTP